MNKLIAIILAGLFSAFAFAPAQGQNINVSSPIIPSPFTSIGAGFPRLQAALKNPANQTIACFGESETAGLGSFYQTPTLNGAGDSLSGSFCNQVAIQLRQLGYNVRSNSLAGNGNVGANSAAAALRDTRITPGAWDTAATIGCNLTIGAGFGGWPGGCTWATNTNGGTFTFTQADTATYPQNASYPTDTMDIWTLSISGTTGVLTIDNGGSACGTIDTTVKPTLTWNKSTITCPSTGTVWHIVSTSGSINYFTQFIVRNSSIPEVSMVNVAVSGAVNAYWLQTSAATGTGGTIIQQIAASMNIVGGIYQDLGNDIDAGTATGTITTQTQSIISALQPTADFLLVTFSPQQPDTTVNSGKSPYTTQSSYVSAQIAAATAQNAAIFNWWKYLCGTATGNTTATKDCWQGGQGGGWNAQNAGNTADPDHQGGIAYSNEAAQIVQFIKPPQVLQFLLRRDVGGPANDNRPVGIDVAA